MKRSAFCLFLLLWLAACVRVGTEAPQKDFFTIEAARPGDKAPQPLFGPLRLEPVRVSSEFRGKPFVYRTEALQFQEDFYNRFFASPGDLITEQTARWLRTSGLFPRVYTEPAPEEPATFLQGDVSALYGDFRATPPMAVLEMGFTLLSEKGARPQTVLHREYRQEVPLQGKKPADLAAGWSDALTRILTALEDDLRAAAGEDLR